MPALSHICDSGHRTPTADTEKDEGKPGKDSAASGESAVAAVSPASMVDIRVVSAPDKKKDKARAEKLRFQDLVSLHVCHAGHASSSVR